MSNVIMGALQVQITRRVEISFEPDERPAVRGDRLPQRRPGDTVREREARIVSAIITFEWDAVTNSWKPGFASQCVVEQRKTDGTWAEPKTRSEFNYGPSFVSDFAPKPLTTVVVD